MKLKVYYNIHPGQIDNALKSISVDIEGKLGTFFDASYDKNGNILLYDEEYDFIGPIIETRQFNCEYDNTYFYKFKKLKLNYKFTFYHIHGDDDGTLPGLTGYVHLNKNQKQKIEYLFGRHWIQKSENVKWLISIPISIITTLITLYITSNIK